MPRPHSQRQLNEYTETPTRSNSEEPSSKKSSDCSKNHSKNDKLKAETGSETAIKEQPHKGNLSPHCFEPPSGSSKLTDEPNPKRDYKSELKAAKRAAAKSKNSIFCPQCGKCRCDACQRPRILPQRWLFNDRCRCSSQSVLDTITCMCCAKAFFYHCSSETSDDDDDDGANDSCDDCDSSDFCTCFSNQKCHPDDHDVAHDHDDDHDRAHRCCCCFRRHKNRHRDRRRDNQQKTQPSISYMLCLSALAIPLPCLLCYLPLKGLFRLCEFGYTRHFRPGCRCKTTKPAVELDTPTLQKKKLVLDSFSS